jgi:hypothetical protein
MRRFIPFALIPLAALPLAFATTGCPGMNEVDCIDLNTCDCTYDEGGICHLDDAGEGGTSEGGSADGAATDGSEGGNTIDAPPGCDLTKDPKDSLPCVSDSVGVFVDGTSGADTNPGTKAKPFKTIGKAISSAGALPRAYVCAGTYGENLTIDSGHALSLFGGFVCGSWTYDASNKVKVNPPSGVGLLISGANGVVIEDLEIDGAADTGTPGDSAIAVLASSSIVTLKRAVLASGDGTDGAKGAVGSAKPNYATANASTGANANGAVPGPATPCACLDGTTTSTGGKGAAQNGFADDGTAKPPVGALNGGSTGGGTCTDGTVGANGLTKAGGGGSTTSGAASGNGWNSAGNATAGGTGNPGQGGGGGGAKNSSASGGGGGGCGGCGGTGGGPGGNGGSSYALLSLSSTLAIDNSTLTSGKAGSGGAGGDAQDGQGAGGAGQGAGIACNGGPGGIGGGGRGGGGGSAGFTAAIAYVGSAPKTTVTTTTPGAKGSAGGGGQPGAGGGNGGASGTPGGAGDSQAVLKLQ